jgi:hypothetical protein
MARLGCVLLDELSVEPAARPSSGAGREWTGFSGRALNEWQ